MSGLKRAVLRKLTVLVDTLNNFKNEVLAEQGCTVDLLLRYNRRIVEELIEKAEQKQMADYLGVKYPNAEDGRVIE